MAKMRKFGTISGDIGNLIFYGFDIDTEGDESIYKHEKFGDDNEFTSRTFNPLKAVEVILICAICELNKELQKVQNKMARKHDL